MRRNDWISPFAGARPSAIPMASLVLMIVLTAESKLAAAEPAAHAEVEALEQKVDSIAEELTSLREQMQLQEATQLDGQHGFAPAASKVYGSSAGFSIGGYGEAYYSKGVDGPELGDAEGDEEGEGKEGESEVGEEAEGEGQTPDSSDFYRFILYTGYKFSDRLLLNAELEWEHANSEVGEVAIEFAYLDFGWMRSLNFRAGMLLVPMGFINQTHEPPFYRGNFRPGTERYIIPTTWRENGLGLYGELLPNLEYKLYFINGMNGKGFSDAGVRGGRQGGAKVLAEDLASVVRLDYDLRSLLQIGASFYYGNSGQGQNYEIPQKDEAGNPLLDDDGLPLYDSVHPDIPTMIYESHVQLRYKGIELRALYAGGRIGDADILSAAAEKTVPNAFFGYYGEISADILPMLHSGSTRALVPWLRYEFYDTQAVVPEGLEADPARAVRVFAAGLDYKPHPKVAVKLDYRDIASRSEDGENATSINLGIGYVF